MKRILFLGFCSLIAISSMAQSEICDDGIDNDKDGFIDCYDPDCSKFNKCDGTFLGNDVVCQAQPIAFPKFTITEDFKSPDNSTNNLSRAAVGDLDRDGIPEIITMNRYTKQLIVLNGNGGSVKYQTTTTFAPQWEIAIANLDNDNCAEIFNFEEESYKDANNNTQYRYWLTSYNCDLTTRLWQTQIQSDPINFGVADFNGDGKAEVYAKDEIYDAKTGVRLVKSKNWGSLNGGPVAVDVDGDANLELVIGCIIYSVNLGDGTLDNGSLTEISRVPNYYKRNDFNATSVADYNLDGYLDILASGSDKDGSSGNPRNTTIFFWDVHNNAVTTFFDTSAGAYLPDGWGNGTGRLNIADLDGDGKLNVSYVSGKFLYALDENLGLKWRVVINEETSGYTGCTLFDFNGDGKSEIVYRDERFIYIINGTDGSIFTQQACVSRTNREYPIVADVDADGSTEICVPCISNDGAGMDFTKFGSQAFLEAPSQMRIFKSASEPWVPARRVWNQHGYFNVNVNDDLTIPKIQQKHHLVFSTGGCVVGPPRPNRPLNSFLNQSPYLNSKGCPTYASPDLAHVANSLVVIPPTCPDANFTISFKITNLGDVQLDGIVPISFYSGDPTKPGAIKLDTINVSLKSFKPSSIFSISNEVVKGLSAPFTLYIVLNDNGTTVPTPIKLPNSNFVECDYGNNIIKSPINPKPVAITALKVADNTKCVGSNTPDNGAVRAFVLTGTTENTSDYNFFWFNGATVTGTPAHTGATYSGLAAGKYTVYGVHKTAGCSSDTVTVTVGQINRTVSVDITLVSGVTDCKVPNGQLKAVANNGAEPASNFSFAWYEGNDIFTSPKVGVSDVATDLKALTYTVLVTDKGSGCPTVESINVPNNTVQPVVSTSQTNILCSSANSGSASANVGGATSGFTFEWSKGTIAKPTADFTGSSYTNLAAGKYTVIARKTSSNCTSNPVTVTITQTTQPGVTATASAQQTSCDPTKPNGSVSATGSGGSGNFSFEWFKGLTTAVANKISSTSTATGLDVGTYTVKITDTASGCTATDKASITLSIGATPVITATPVNQTQCVPYNGNITASVSVGLAADYTYSWYKGSSVKATTDFPTTTNVLNDLPAGTYTVKAIHKTNFCQAAAKTFTVLDKSPTITILLNSSITVFPTDCNSADGVMAVNVSAPSNTLGFKAEWYLGKSPYAAPSIQVDNGVTTSTASGLKSGVYSVIATDLNSGCLSTKAFDLPFVSSPTLSLIGKTDITKCVPDNDGQVTFKINLPAVGGFTESDYDFFTYRGTNDPGASGTSVVPVIPGVAAQPNYSTAATLTADSYTVVAVSKKAGQFNGCRSVPLTVDIDKKTTEPVISSGTITPNTNCTGAAGTGQITATADVASSFDWFNGSSVKASPDLANSATYSNLVSALYTVRATDNTTGCFSVATFGIPNNAMPVAIAANGLTVQDLMNCNVATGSVINNGSATVTSISPGSLSDYTFSWSNASGPLPGNSTTISNLTAGTYFMKAVNTISNCFTDLEFKIDDKTIGSTSVELTAFTKPERCVAPKTGSLTVGSTPSYNYEWFAGTAPSGPVVNNTNDLQGITVPAGQSNVTYTIKAIGPNNCWAVDSYVLPLVVNEVFITASSSSPLTNCGSPNGVVFSTVINDNSLDYSYNWSNGSVAKATPDYSGKQVQNLGAGSYTIIAVDLLDNFCVSQPKTVLLEDKRVNPVVAAAQSAPLTNCDPAKLNGVASANVNGDVIHYTFDWYTGATATGTSFYSGSEAGSLKDGTYTVVATDRITGCFGAAQVTVSKNLTTVNNPQITVLSEVTSCLSPNGALGVSVDGVTKDYDFSWYVGNVVKSSVDYTGEVVNDLDVGIYTVTATSRLTGCTSGPDTDELIKKQSFPEFDFKVVAASCQANNGSATLYLLNNIAIETIEWDANGTKVYGPTLANALAGTYSVTITTQLGCTSAKNVSINTDIRPYNGISRNGDGHNDIFYINCIENFPSNNVKVFNRAGTMVYEGDNYDNTSTFFDGKSNRGVSPMGINLPDGTYYYVINKGDGSKPMAGYLELVN